MSIKSRRNRSLQAGDRKHVPLPTGPLPIVGCRDIMTGFTKKGGVLVRLYYPAADQTKNIEQQNLIWPNWLPHENYGRGYGDVAGFRWEPFFRFIQRMNGDTFIPVIPNAKPLRPKDGKPYPAIIFSHGLGACRTTYSAICMEMASHGFIVAAVEHRDNTACLSFYAKQIRYSMKDSNPNFFSEVDGLQFEDEPDFGDEIDDPNYVPPKALTGVTSVPHIAMEWVRYRNVAITRTNRKIYNFRNKQIHHRVRECSRALDLIEALQAGYELNNLLDPLFNISEFEGLIDMDKCIIMGHSMGGATAIMSAGAELRFKVAVALDPWMYPIKDEMFDLVTQPIICINTGTMDADAPNMAKVKELLVTPAVDENVAEDFRKAVSIKGSVHFNQCDSPFVFNWFVKLFIGSFGGRSSRDRFTAHDLTNYLALSFIGQHLDIPINEDVETYLREQKKKVRPSFKK